MAITFKESRIYVNGTEPSAGQLAGFTKNDLYTPWNSNSPKESGYVLLYVSSSTKYKGYVAGYSGNYYITRLKFNTTEPLKSVSVTLSCTGNDNTNGTYKRGIVATTDSTLATNYSSFKSRSDLSLIRFTSTTVTVVCDANVIPAGDFYIYIGPGPNDTNGKFSTIFAQQSASLALSVTGTPADTYTISYDANGGGGATSSHKVIKGYSTKLAQNNFTAPSTRLYTVTLNGNGGNNGTPTYGSPANKFYRWIKDSASGTTYYDAGADFKPTANTTFYAQWYTPTTMGTTTRGDGEADGYTVKFNANGGSCSTNQMTAKDRVEYSFNSWNTKIDGTGSTLNSTSTYKIYYTGTFFAQWDSDQIEGSGSIELPTATNKSTTTLTITLDYQGGNGSITSKNSTKTVIKQFKGWGTSATTNDILPNPYTPSEDEETLFAVWGTASVSYTSFDLPTPTKVGYKFKGWATSASASSGTTGSYTPTSDNITTLFAIWDPDGNVRIYINSTDKYKTALVYVYVPSGAGDKEPWKLAIPYLYTSGTQPWKIIAG